MVRISVVLITLALSLVACGPSEPSAPKGPSAEERNRIASRACSEIMNTRKFESSKRASTYNDAVDKLGLNGSYWNELSDDLLELKLIASSSYKVTQDCVTSLLKGNPPFGKIVDN